MNNILQNKTKNITAIIFSCLYAFMTFIGFDFNLAHYANLRYAVNNILMNVSSLFLPVAVIVFIALRNKDFAFKKWLLPIAFGLMLVKGSFTLFMSFANTITVFKSENEPLFLIMLLCSSLSLAATVLMFIGTVGNFKLVALLKYGALSNAVLVFLFIVLEFIASGGIEYFEIISELSNTVTFWISYIRSLIVFIAQILFYIGLFILFPSKKSVKEEITA